MILILFVNCKEENHIEKYNIDLEELLTLPDQYYGHHRGTAFITNENYTVWFNRDSNYNIQSIKRIDNVNQELLTPYEFDTIESKKIAQKFGEFSRKYRFGHIYVDKKNKIYFSSQQDLSEEYVITFNDSVYNVYQNNKNFQLLKNGWFKHQQ